MRIHIDLQGTFKMKKTLKMMMNILSIFMENMKNFNTVISQILCFKN